MDGRKNKFIIKLAAFLVENQAGKSIALEMESPSAIVPWAHEWARVRAETPLSGYPTLPEAADRVLARLAARAEKRRAS